MKLNPENLAAKSKAGISRSDAKNSCLFPLGNVYVFGFRVIDVTSRLDQIYDEEVISLGRQCGTIKATKTIASR